MSAPITDIVPIARNGHGFVKNAWPNAARAMPAPWSNAGQIMSAKFIMCHLPPLL